MEQQTTLVQKFSYKPSEFLRQAYYNGVKKVEGSFHADGGHCAAGILAENTLDFSGFDGTPDEISTIFNELIRLNDSSPNVTFLDCAKFLESKGL